MPAVFDQLLGSNQSKTAGTSLAISPSSKTVTVGKTIFVSFASDDVGSDFDITDNLGNTYSQVGTTAVFAGNVKTQLWSAPVTVGGSITTITISWTTNITAKGAVACEFSNFGSQRLTENSTGSAIGVHLPANEAFFDGELWIQAYGVEDDVAPTSAGTTGAPGQTIVVAGSNGTTGGGSASNIFASLGYILINGNSTDNATLGLTNGGSTQDVAGVGVIYNPAAAVRQVMVSTMQAIQRAANW